MNINLRADASGSSYFYILRSRRRCQMHLMNFQTCRIPFWERDRTPHWQRAPRIRICYTCSLFCSSFFTISERMRSASTYENGNTVSGPVPCSPQHTRPKLAICIRNARARFTITEPLSKNDIYNKKKKRKAKEREKKNERQHNVMCWSRIGTASFLYVVIRVQINWDKLLVMADIKRPWENVSSNESADLYCLRGLCVYIQLFLVITI